MAEDRYRDDLAMEREEFLSFTLPERLHIARALAVARDDTCPLSYLATEVAGHSMVSGMLFAEVAMRYRTGMLDEIRSRIPRDGEASANTRLIELLMPALIWELNLDLAVRFSPLRFLFERLIGPEIRPFMAAGYAAATLLPRFVREFQDEALHSIDLDETESHYGRLRYFPITPDG